jgi:hypothetical protein
MSPTPSSNQASRDNPLYKVASFLFNMQTIICRIMQVRILIGICKIILSFSHIKLRHFQTVNSIHNNTCISQTKFPKIQKRASMSTYKKSLIIIKPSLSIDKNHYQFSTEEAQNKNNPIK